MFFAFKNKSTSAVVTGEKIQKTHKVELLQADQYLPLLKRKNLAGKNAMKHKNLCCISNIYTCATFLYHEKCFMSNFQL